MLRLRNGIGEKKEGRAGNWSTWEIRKRKMDQKRKTLKKALQQPQSMPILKKVLQQPPQPTPCTSNLKPQTSMQMKMLGRGLTTLREEIEGGQYGSMTM